MRARACRWWAVVVRCLAGCLALAGLLVLLRPVVLDGGALAAGEGTAVFLVGGVRFRVGSEMREMDAAPFVDSGRTFVPVRYLAYALGVPEEGVSWDGLAPGSQAG